MTEEKFKKKTSNQKAKEEYEKIKAERAKKKEVNFKQIFWDCRETKLLQIGP